MAERGGGFYSEANGSKEIKEHSLHEKLPRRNIVCEVREAETCGGRSRNTRTPPKATQMKRQICFSVNRGSSEKKTIAVGDPRE